MAQEVPSGNAERFDVFRFFLGDDELIISGNRTMNDSTLKTLRTGLMQDLLTGRGRVKVDEEDNRDD